MAEPETEATDISLRAAEVATDVSETDQPAERRRLVSAFTKAATSGARAAAKSVAAAEPQNSAARRAFSSLVSTHEATRTQSRSRYTAR